MLTEADEQLFELVVGQEVEGKRLLLDNTPVKDSLAAVLSEKFVTQGSSKVE